MSARWSLDQGFRLTLFSGAKTFDLQARFGFVPLTNNGVGGILNSSIVRFLTRLLRLQVLFRGS